MLNHRIVALATVCLCVTAPRAELVQQFKNPAFNGIGWSNHALTIDSIERSRKDAIEAKRKAEVSAAIAASENTPLARFMNLFQSQVYAQLANQLSTNLFQNRCVNGAGESISGCVGPATGAFTLDGNTVTWVKTNDEVSLTVVDGAGTTTTVRVPIASFSF